MQIYCKMICTLPLFGLALLAGAATVGQSVADDDAVKVETERLPDLHIARTDHRTLCLSGVPTVMGGHTDGFKPTATAEYFSDGAWHQLDMVYAHDDGLVLPLASGRVRLAGGHKDDLGIGQIHSAEMYDPATHTFDGFGCLDTKRAIFGGTEIDSARVLISGNWYHDDSMELFDGRQGFTYIKDVAQPRSHPYIFRTAADNAVVFSICGPTVDEIHDTVIVDQLHGEPFTPQLFQQWKPLRLHIGFNGEQSRIGEYDYLFPVTDSTGQVAIARLQGFNGQWSMENGQWSMENGQWSILPTDRPVPMSDGHWQEHLGRAPKGGWTGEIQWLSPVIADREHSRAYMVGAAKDEADDIQMLYVLGIGLQDIPQSANHPNGQITQTADHPNGQITQTASHPNGQRARLTLYYAVCPPQVAFSLPVLTPSGNLLMAGGVQSSGFKPSASAIVIHLGGAGSEFATTADSHWWLWTLAAVMIAGVVYCIKRLKGPTPSPSRDGEASPLMPRIIAIMETRRVYLNPELKMSDIADALGVHKNTVSACINAQAGCSFTQFVNRYRVEHAQELLRRNPEMKITAVCKESGFSTESSFFRAFRAICNTTPREWLAANGQEPTGD